jgi:hypothetical protein
VLSAIGIHAAVIPHFDNAEGAGHDTRFCFLGERRLALLENSLPDGVYVLGVDEHTALLIDIDAERAFVHGRGAVTLRRRERIEVIASGADVELDRLRNGSASEPPAPDSASAGTRTTSDADGLARRLAELEQRFESTQRQALLVEPLIAALVDLRKNARAGGDYATADAIRDRLAALGIGLTDTEDGMTHVDTDS